MKRLCEAALRENIKMSEIEWVRDALRSAADPQYRDFHQSLVPGLDSMLGVRMPKCREIARKIARGDWEAFLCEADDGCYEELMLQGLVIGYARMTQEQRSLYLSRFVPKINNWAICDCCCSTYKFMKQDRSYWLDFLRQYLEGMQEFEVRFVVVSLLNHFMEEEYLDTQFGIYEGIYTDDSIQVPFYIQMAAAWALSVCYVHFPEPTEEFLRRQTLDVFTHNKAIQKIRESCCVPKEEKDRLLLLKR